MTLRLVAIVALVFWALYQVAFVAAGYRPRGGAGLKTLGLAAELLVWTVLVWAVVR